MSTDFTLHATSREDTGKGASRRLRRLAQVIPAIVYGGTKKPAQISLVHKDVLKSLENEAFYSHILSLEIDGKGEDVIIKDIQRHPAKPQILHMDFLRVSKSKPLHTKVPLHFINEESCAGVKTDGGLIAHTMTELDITCLPANLPEYIEVDMLDVRLGDTVHISDIKLPKGVESVALSHGQDHDLPIASVQKTRASSDADSAETEAGEEASEE